MANEKFILLNIEDQKSKELAQIISSDTARKILNLLSEKSYDETTIGKKLNIPLSTVHYNIQALLKSNIIEIHDFLWSEKGKKINIYKLANKLIVIAPKNNNNDDLSNKLKSIIPAALIGLIFSVSIFLYQNMYKLNIIQKTKSISGAELMISSEAKEISPVFIPSSDPALWFLGGVLTVITFYIIYSLLKRK